MAATLVTAHDELITAFLVGWNKAPAEVGDTGKYEYVVDFNDPDGVPDHPLQRPWARIKAVHSSGSETSVSGRRYENGGVFYIQIFIPKSVLGAKIAARKGQTIAQAVSDGLKRHRGPVVLTKIRFNDVPADGAYFRQDVLCQFSWTEVRSILDGR